MTGAAMAPGRWPPLERRILDPLAGEPGGVSRRDLMARLETVPGNEWVVEEAVADLLQAGALREEEGEDGSRTLRAAASPGG
ncbi:MAG: hypothetical protein AB1416_00980 [Actinomycetota bacterium]